MSTSTNYYGSGLYYGAGHFWGASGIDVPVDYQWFRTNSESRYVFHWTFDPLYISPLLLTLDWEVQIDSVPTFDSINLTSWTISTAASFQNGDASKGFEIIVPSRLSKNVQTLYSRVRTIHGSASSNFSETISFTIPDDYTEESAERMTSNLPDSNVYDKDVLNEDPVDRKTKLHTLTYRKFGKEFDGLHMERILTIGDSYVRASRDEALYDNFGKYFEFVKPQSMENIDYRRCLEYMLIGSLVGGTIDSIIAVVMGFTGVPPTITNVRDSLSFITFVSELDPDVVYLDDLTTPPVLVDTSAAAFGIIIFINNPGLFTLDLELITFLIRQIVPAHINVQVIA